MNIYIAMDTDCGVEIIGVYDTKQKAIESIINYVMERYWEFVKNVWQDDIETFGKYIEPEQWLYELIEDNNLDGYRYEECKVE